MTKIFGAALVSILFMASCSNNDSTSSDPNVVLERFFDHLAKKDIDGAAKFVTADSKPVLQMVEKGMQLAEHLADSFAHQDFSKKIEDVTIEPARVAGDSAFILVRNKKEDSWNAEFLLLNQNGWKVDFSMKALTQMGKTKRTLDEIRDSVPMSNEDLEKGLRMADSVLKNLDPKMIDQIQKQLEGLK